MRPFSCLCFVLEQCSRRSDAYHFGRSDAYQGTTLIEPPVVDIHAALRRPVKKGRIELHFEIKGEEYFLNFVPSQGKWFLLTPTQEGFQVTSLVNDDALPPIDDVDPLAGTAARRKIN